MNLLKSKYIEYYKADDDDDGEDGEGIMVVVKLVGWKLVLAC